MSLQALEAEQTSRLEQIEKLMREAMFRTIEISYAGRERERERERETTCAEQGHEELLNFLL